MLEFRQHAAKILDSLKARKETIRLTYRGKAVADLVPVPNANTRRPSPDDPFYRIIESGSTDGEDLTNPEIDRILYGQS